MSENHRDLKTSEIKELRSFVSPVTAVVRWFIFSLLFFPLTFLFYKVNVSLVSGIGRYAWLILASLLAWWLLNKFNKWSGGSDFRAAVKKDILQGEAYEKKILVQKCIMFREEEDEGDSYFVEDNEGETFFFSGQELPKKFPRSEVTVVTAPSSNHMFRITTTGELIDCFVAPTGISKQPSILNEVGSEICIKTSFVFEEVLQGLKWE